MNGCVGLVGPHKAELPVRSPGERQRGSKVGVGFTKAFPTSKVHLS